MRSQVILKLTARGALIVATGLLTWAPPARAAVLTKELFTPIAGSVDDPCNGETVAFSGQMLTLVTLTATPALDIATFKTAFMNVTATGETTGTVYQYRCVQNATTLQSSGITGSLSISPHPLSISTSRSFCIVSNNNALFTGLAHYSITPNGTTAVSFDNFEVMCTGGGDKIGVDSQPSR